MIPMRRLGIEVAGRLVGQQQRRVVDERARHRDALLLAAGELVGKVVQLEREAGQAQDVRHLVADLAARAAGDLERVGDVVVDRPVRQQLEVLEDHADVAPVVRDPLARDLREVLAGDARACRVWCSSSLISRRMIVDLPEPVGPTMNTNSPGWIAKVAPRGRRWSPGRLSVTSSKSITEPTRSGAAAWRSWPVPARAARGPAAGECVAQ